MPPDEELGGVYLLEDEPEPLIVPVGRPTTTPPPEKVSRAVNDFFRHGEKEVWIVLEENVNIPPTGQFIGLNGRTWMLRPGVKAKVPLGIVNVLNDAVESVPEMDPNTQQIVGYRRKLRFPYTLVVGP